MLILKNARIYTMHPAHPVAGAIAIAQDKILAIGTTEEILAGYGHSSSITDMQGHVILPGLTDAHIHLQYYAFNLQSIDCETPTREECLRRVAERSQNTPPGTWLIGHGWNHNNWSEGLGDRLELDRVAPNHPVYLTAKSLHASWANSQALELARISTSTADPTGGTIQRDATGQPTGILLESAMELVQAMIPEPTPTQISEAIEQAQRVLWAMGITGVHDFDQIPCFVALQTLNEQGKLHLRVVKGIPRNHLSEAAGLGLRTGFGGDYLRIGSVKLFADGALGPQTAAMLQPYEGNSDSTGMLQLDEEEIFEIGQQAARSGLSLAIHAIGDRANHEVLNAIAQLRAYEDENHLGHPRHRIEHVQLLHPDDINRLAALNVIASMQPIHAISDMQMADRHWGQRAASSYAWNSVLRENTALAFGSDAPVEIPNPFWGLYAAVTRRSLTAKSETPSWYPSQCISLEEALVAYTRGAAFAAGIENRVGQLAPGFFADLIVLENDPFENPPEALIHTRPINTMVGGKWVWKG